MISSLARFLLDPFNLLWIWALIMFIFWYSSGKGKYLKWFAISWVVFFLIVSTPLLPVLLVNSLEDRYSPLDVNSLQDPDESYHIVVLGGGHGYDDRLPANALLSSNALGRLAEGIRLHKQLPGSVLVLSGSTSIPGKSTQAEMLKRTAKLLGVDETFMLTQSEPTNTCQEAQVYSNRYENKYQIILVTSAMHMPRAVSLFKDFGIEPIPSATNYRLKGSWKEKWFGFPSLKNIELTGIALTAYAAMTEAKLRQLTVGDCR